ncbi:MAG: acyltransferase family protein [Gammaproteobacteria bacterium]|nr:acyltransferase family protein [Gammaproteobacteria bacterium]
MTTLMKPKSRLFFIDNLKALLITLVIIHHVGQAYGATGGSWPISNPERVPALRFLFTLDRSFFMSLFFMLAGYFVPISVDRKGMWKYIKDRLIRLGVPMVFFLVVLYPILGYFLHAHYLGEPIKFWSYYWHLYWNVGIKPLMQAANLGPLWFISLLLVLSIGYVLLHPFTSHLRKLNDYLRARSLNQILLSTIFIIIPLTFIVRLRFPIDQWLNYIIFMVAPADLPRDMAFFILGIIAYRQNLLATTTRKQGYSWLAVGVLLGVFYILFSCYERFFFGGGFSFNALRYDIWETVYCMGMCMGLIVLFREVFNWSNAFWGMLAEDAFAVYLFHFPIVIMVQYFFVTLNIGPLSKFFMVSLIAVPLTFFMCHWIRKIPGMKRII